MIAALAEDHPRLCGEKGWQTKPANTVLGSPPPMRGKVKEHFTGAYNARITPAYAGKSYNFLTIFQFTQDHPRLCGEK